MPMRPASNGVLPAAPFVDVEAESLNTAPSESSIVEITSQQCAFYVRVISFQVSRSPPSASTAIGGLMEGGASSTDYLRSDLNPARTSSEKSCGCSQAAKCPPLSSLL